MAGRVDGSLRPGVSNDCYRRARRPRLGFLHNSTDFVKRVVAFDKNESNKTLEGHQLGTRGGGTTMAPDFRPEKFQISLRDDRAQEEKKEREQEKSTDLPLKW